MVDDGVAWYHRTAVNSINGKTSEGVGCKWVCKAGIANNNQQKEWYAQLH